ncbi:MAG TPA: DUF4180 domain-containing protein [Rubricoccaceae bacterium]|jgi:hypothetical protein
MLPYFEPNGPGPFDPNALVTACIEAGAPALLADVGALSPAFFDLSSGVAGDVLRRLTLYGVAMAAVVSDLSKHSASFQAFAVEANRGTAFRSFGTRAEAVLWLEERVARTSDPWGRTR